MAMSLLPAETRNTLLDMMSAALCCPTSAVSFPMYSWNNLSWLGSDTTPCSHAIIAQINTNQKENIFFISVKKLYKKHF